jgi:hypothetical protein
MRSAVLCPATQASIAAELGLDRPHDCAEKWFDDEIHICEACGTETRELKNNRLAKLKPPPDDGTTDICF